MDRRPRFVIAPPRPRKPTRPPALLELDMPPAIISFDAPTVAAPTPTPSYSYYTDPAPAPAPAPLPPPPALPTGSVPAQVVIYEPQGPVPYEGTAVTQPDGSIELQVSVPTPPIAGTPVQVILYDTAGNPTIYEGVTGAVGPDGSFPIIL